MTPKLQRHIGSMIGFAIFVGLATHSSFWAWAAVFFATLLFELSENRP